MENYTDVSSKKMACFVKLEKICKEKQWNDRTRTTLKKWLISVLANYNPSSNILDHFEIFEYIENNLQKLEKAKDITILSLQEVLENPKCLLHNFVQRLSFNQKECESLAENKNDEYYLSASGVCCAGNTIEVVDEMGSYYTLHHELQHIHQNYAYPSEFPFAEDMLQILKEGEAVYHRHLIDIKNYDINSLYDKYYLLYTLLMFIVPQEMRFSWNKIDISFINCYTFSDVFKPITDSEIIRNNISYIFALISLIVSSYNSENSKEIIESSLEQSLNHCSKKITNFNQMVQTILDTDGKLETPPPVTKYFIERLTILKNPDLLQRSYLEFIREEKELISTEPKDAQEKLLQELETLTFDKYVTSFKNDLKEYEESVLKYSNKKIRSAKEILGEKDYCLYQYYQFGIELSKAMKVLLNQKLTHVELFQHLFEKITDYLIENKVDNMEEKLNFIQDLRTHFFNNSKTI